MSRMKTVWLIAGPTAGGKSKLALDLARLYNGVIINADSMQVYREIPILSAQPSSYDNQLIPHFLYGIQPISKNFSSAEWASHARDAIYETLESGHQPILVGGSGLYFKALTEGFSPIPEVPPAIRKHVSDLYDMLGPNGFHETLRKIDPVLAKKLNPNDRQRCIRAREVYESSGEQLSAWQKAPKKNIAPDLTYRSIILLPERNWLNDRINKRFVEMVDHGAVDEARIVHTLNVPHDRTGTHALGLQALRDYLDGRLTLAEAIEQGQTHSRQYAKRQSTWFRNQGVPDAYMITDPHQDWLALAQKHLHST